MDDDASDAGGEPDHGRNFGFPAGYRGECDGKCGDAMVQEVIDGQWVGAEYDHALDEWHSGREKVGFTVAKPHGVCFIEHVEGLPNVDDVAPDCKFADKDVGLMVAVRKKNKIYIYIYKSPPPPTHARVQLIRPMRMTTCVTGGATHGIVLLLWVWGVPLQGPIQPLSPCRLHFVVATLLGRYQY